MASYPPERTAEEAVSLFKAVEERFPSESLGDDRWYLILISALPGAGSPEFAVQLYSYLIQKPQFSTPETRQALVRRLREALMKCVSIYGVCRPLEVVFGITKIERPEDKDYSFSRENWQSGPDNYARGAAWLSRIYQHNHAAINEALSSHKDFNWLSFEITYGLYLSDHSIINDVETEIVVLSGIMIQNLRSETHWHLRGIRRVGVTQEDVEKIHQCIELVAEFSRVRVDKVPRVADVEHEV